ncbi:sigma-70 family RNA polymerase sigma factor [Chitinophaga oryzae]|uniref:Sigma-70 family RNA polymerase sigma factor n=1 Tax=Chitinophaga oryzae TaxID=2725414 RepID=A0AAE6ZF22_9BACT|nr:sigma-70 family RNA polymerase sigma factor [Chitinophaga oryzae]QJB31476.1 sigma-70 family RNA polymerase sigma factor [Chitinophaga oryzae]
MQQPVTAIWQQFSNELEKFICRQTGDDSVCKDLLQEVFMKVYVNSAKVSAADNIRAYLYRVASNVITDHHRRRQNGRQVSAVYGPEAADEIMHPGDEYKLADCLRPMVAALPPIYRQALTLTDLNGYTQKQYAEISGISASGAKSRVQRARQRLKEMILQCCEYEFDKYGNILSCCDHSSPRGKFC